MNGTTRRQQHTVLYRFEEEADSETTSTSEAADEALVCPECGGQLQHDTEHGETVCRECGLVVDKNEVGPPDPENYIAKYASELDVGNELKERAYALLRQVKADGLHSGKSPVGLAAAALYAVGFLVNEKLTQGGVSEVTNVSEVTIRNRYQELLENEEAQQQAPLAD